jgi:hypothetical protein
MLIEAFSPRCLSFIGAAAFLLLFLTSIGAATTSATSRLLGFLSDLSDSAAYCCSSWKDRNVHGCSIDIYTHCSRVCIMRYGFFFESFAHVFSRLALLGSVRFCASRLVAHLLGIVPFLCFFFLDGVV